MLKVTKGSDLSLASFWWRVAFLVLWYAATLLVSMFHPHIAFSTLFLIPLFAWAVAKDWPADMAGASYVGVVGCILAGPPVHMALFEAGYFADNRGTTLGVCAAMLVVAMTIGFVIGRWVAGMFPSRP